MTDAQLVGLVILAAMSVPCLLVAWEARRAPLCDDAAEAADPGRAAALRAARDPEVRAMPVRDAVVVIAAAGEIDDELDALLSDGRRG